MKSSPAKHVILASIINYNILQCCAGNHPASMILIILICFLQTTLAEKIAGYKFEDDLLARQPSVSAGLASYTVETPYPMNLSICAWVYPEFWRFPRLGILEVRAPETMNKTYPNVHLLFRKGMFEVLDTDSFKFAALNRNILRKWNGICTSIDHTRNEGSAAHNGMVTEARQPNTAPSMGGRYGGKIWSNSSNFTVLVGRYSIDRGVFIGKMAGINIWNRTLTKNEMKSFTDCKAPKRAIGNLISDQTVFDLNNNKNSFFEMSLEDVSCTDENTIENIFIPIVVSNRQDAYKTCKKLGSESVGGEFLEEASYENFYKILYSNEIYKRNCWIGGRLRTILPYKENKDGTGLIHEIKNTSLGIDFWAPFSDIPSKYPRAVKNPGCLLAYFGIFPYKENLVAGFDGYSLGSVCSWPSCFACEMSNSFEKTSTIRMRGLCKNTFFDKEYLISTGPDGYIRYIGTRSTIIDYDETAKQWVMSVVTRPEVVATSNASARSLLVGNNEWVMTGDTECFSGTSTVLLSMTTCTSEEYTCDDGHCIHLSRRCDGRSDCGDVSDEARCKTVEIVDTYNKFLTPQNEQATNGKVFPIVINVTMDISKLSSFDEISSNFGAELTLYLLWMDDRLSFDNLRENQESNVITPSEMSQIWIPKLVFKNTKERKKSIVDEDAKVTVIRRSEGRQSDESSPENKITYDGKDNYLLYSRYYNMVFECDFLMNWYPFDTQVCTIEIQPPQGMQKLLAISPQNLDYTGPQNLQQYVVKSVEIVQVKENIEVHMYLGRRLLSIFLTNIVPTLIINCIGHTANYFKEFFFEAIISLNVTVMLVLTTMFISISNNLPKTAYIKMMDAWLLFNLSKPFIDIILQTYMEYLRTDENERVINKHGKEQSIATAGDDLIMSPILIKVAPLSHGSEMKNLK